MKKPSKMKSALNKAERHLKEDNKKCVKENKEHNQLVKKLEKAKKKR